LDKWRSARLRRLSLTLTPLNLQGTALSKKMDAFMPFIAEDHAAVR
jgi:hypothetical protein